ncbi:hypothetical protein [Aequoribacter sp.]|uniref:hypothetical protein n=1 Tax=Aequoribacter sp. TaxID=2847771 RepID=UPI003F69DD49
MQDMSFDAFFSRGIERTKPKYWSLLGNFCLFGLAIVVAAITVIGILIIPALIAGLIHFLLASARGQEPKFGSSFSAGFAEGMWWKSLFLVIVLIVGLMIGFMLLIIPGIYLSVVWFYAFYLLVDKKMDIFETLQTSRKLIHQQGFWKIFGVLLVINIVNSVLSAIPLVSLAALFLVPFIMMIYVTMYQNAIDEDSDDEVPDLEAELIP